MVTSDLRLCCKPRRHSLTKLPLSELIGRHETGHSFNSHLPLPTAAFVDQFERCQCRPDEFAFALQLKSGRRPNSGGFTYKEWFVTLSKLYGNLWTISYVSRATSPGNMTEASLSALCRSAQKYNAKAQITGILTCHNGAFAQILEGSEPALRELLSRITEDTRHYNLRVLADGPIDQRCYADWSMEYLVPSIFVHKQIEGFLQQTNAARRQLHEFAH